MRRIPSVAELKSLFSSAKKKLLTVFSKPQNFFLLFSLGFGFLFIFLTPPLQAPDENSHFLRAYQVSNFDFIGNEFHKDDRVHYGGEIPVSVNEAIPGLMGNVAGKPLNKFNKDTLKEYIGQPLNKSVTQPTIIEAAGVYSPVVYIPQALGINFGKVFNASPLVLIWLARIMSLVTWVIVIYFAIRLLPFAKWALVILALNPVAVFISASLSPDIINISFAFLFVSLILTTFAKDSVLGRKQIILALAVLSVLALSKPINALFALLLFAVPMRHFATKAKYLLFCFGGFLLAVGLFVAWNYQIRDILDAAVYAQSGGQNISVKDQLSYIIHTPVGYIKTIIMNYVLVGVGMYGDAVLTTFFGVFGWLDTSLPLWAMMAYLLTLFLAVLYQFGRGIVLTLYQKLVFLAVFALAFVGSITAMYFNATPVGSSVIGGVQGRYFLPFMVLVLAVFTGRKKILMINNKTITCIFAGAMLVILGMTFYELAARYY